MGNEIVKLFVGKDRMEFTLHKKLICTQSSYFKAGFMGGYREATENTMSMPEDHPDDVQMLVDYVYRGVKALDGASGAELLFLYILAEKICFVRLMVSPSLLFSHFFSFFVFC